MDDEKYFGLTPTQLNLTFLAAVGAVALTAFVYFGGVGAVKEQLGDEQVAVVETATPTPTEAPAAVPAQEQQGKPAAESDPPPPPPQVEEPPPAPPKPTPTPEPPKPSVAPYWIASAASVGIIYVYHPNISCQFGGGYGPAGSLVCSSGEGWTLSCSIDRSLTVHCTHSRDGDFTCVDSSTQTTCVGGLTSTCLTADNSNPRDLTCSRSDGETLTSPYGESVAEEGGRVFYWSGGSFVCSRVDPNWTCN